MVIAEWIVFIVPSKPGLGIHGRFTAVTSSAVPHVCTSTARKLKEPVPTQSTKTTNARRAADGKKKRDKMAAQSSIATAIARNRQFWQHWPEGICNTD